MAGEASTGLAGPKVFTVEYLTMAQRRKLALVAFEQGEGPWIIALGTEHQVQVTNLKDGEQLGLEVDGLVGKIHCFAGLTSIHLEKDWKYRFTKSVPEGWKPSKTCVEVLLNGR